MQNRLKAEAIFQAFPDYPVGPTPMYALSHRLKGFRGQIFEKYN
jgi:hypothetical protein